MGQWHQLHPAELVAASQGRWKTWLPGASKRLPATILCNDETDKLSLSTGCPSGRGPDKRLLRSCLFLLFLASEKGT